MIAAELAILAIVFAAVALLVWTTVEQVVPWWNRRTERYVAWILAEHERMYEPMPIGRARRLLAAATFLPAALGLGLGSIVAAVIFGAVGGATPYVWVRVRQRARTQALDNQLVDALVLMANGLKSGLSLLQAIELAADQLKPPIVDEFGRTLKEIRLGRLIDHALVDMAERLKLADLEIAVHSIVTLRETGGNLSETFMTVANTIVERKKVEGKIRSLTAQGLYQGMALCGMPFAFALLFYIMDPDYMMPMFTTALGWMIWTMVVVLDSLGMWLVLKIVKIDV